jgi:hypothetical protein
MVVGARRGFAVRAGGGLQHGETRRLNRLDLKY